MQYSPETLARMQTIAGTTTVKEEEPKKEVEQESSGIVGSIKSGVNSIIDFFTTSLLRVAIIVVGIILLYIGLRSYLPPINLGV